MSESKSAYHSLHQFGTTRNQISAKINERYDVKTRQLEQDKQHVVQTLLNRINRSNPDTFIQEADDQGYIVIIFNPEKGPAKYELCIRLEMQRVNNQDVVDALDQLASDQPDVYDIIIHDIDQCTDSVPTSVLVKELIATVRQINAEHELEDNPLRIRDLMIGQDASSIQYYFSDGNMRALSLAILKIMTKGMSWYNSLGFVGTQFENNRALWDHLRAMPFGEFLTILHIENPVQGVATRQGALKRSLFIDGLISAFGTTNTVLMSMTTTDVFQRIESFLKQACPVGDTILNGIKGKGNICSESHESQVLAIIALFDLIADSGILEYSPYRLSLVLQKPEKKRVLERNPTAVNSKRHKTPINLNTMPPTFYQNPSGGKRRTKRRRRMGRTMGMRRRTMRRTMRRK